MQNKDIIQELNDLGSILGKIPSTNPYSIPADYFDNFPGAVLSLVKEDEKSASWISSLPKVNPFQIPTGYFDGLEERIMTFIRNHPDYQTSREEVASISPLLNNLSKRPVYAVPEGYFQNFKVATLETDTTGRIVPFPARKWFRVAAAAVTICVVSLTAFMVYKNNHRDAAGRTLARFEREVKKINDVKKTDSLIDFIGAGTDNKEIASTQKASKTDEVLQLLQDVPTDELKDFNDQTRDIEDVMMTN